MAFDYKKEYREFYMPKNKPEIVNVPEMKFIAVRGKGNPNDEDGEYKQAIGLLYGIAFTIKMSKKGSHKIDGYFDYVVPPLEGFWWQSEKAEERDILGINQVGQIEEQQSADNMPGTNQVGRIEEQRSADDMLRTEETSGKEQQCGIDYSRKEDFCWISVIRLPDFVTEEDFKWAIEEAADKKKQDFSKVEFMVINEGLCVQCMHIGAYDDEPATVALMDSFIKENGYVNDFSAGRLHHEIYLSDARRVAPEKLRTVIRHPIKKQAGR